MENFTHHHLPQYVNHKTIYDYRSIIRIDINIKVGIPFNYISPTCKATSFFFLKEYTTQQNSKHHITPHNTTPTAFNSYVLTTELPKALWLLCSLHSPHLPPHH
jgi:hypothetical protein